MIDVIIPAYIPNKNYIFFLNRALKSLEEQTFENFTVKVVFNGLFEDEKNIINKIKYNKNIDFFNLREKKSAASARNYAIKKCNSKYIAQLDVDDQYINTKLEKQLYFMENNLQVDALGTLYYILNKENISNAPYAEHQFETNDQIKSIIKYINVMCCGSMFFKSDIFNKHNLWYDEAYRPGDIWPNYKKKMWEDWDLWIRMIGSGLIFHTLPERLYVWSAGTSVHDNDL